ncbi:MAG: hypothetical protein IT367_06905 [Candidatus Hydrogenedentes bacterium]|nr:hypothetical protein [Candidatus Hydrogenedentota bacterium]
MSNFRFIRFQTSDSNRARSRNRLLLLLLFVTSCVSLKAYPVTTAFDTDGAITVDGKRTFIVGTYMVGNKYTAPTPTPQLYKELADAGFNLVQASGENMDHAEAAGLMTWTGAGVIDLKDPEASGKQLADRVNAVKGHPSLAFLETSDEPAWTWMKAEPRITAEAFAKSYPIVKATDPNHLLYTNHAPTNLISTLVQYNAGTDIVAVDIYPVNPGNLKPQYALFEDGLQGDLNNTHISQVGDYCDKMRKVAGPNRPVFMVLQGFAWEMLTDEKDRDPAKVLYPTFEQSRYMAWQSIVHGANGIVYWGSFYTPQPSDCWTGVTRTTREIADLGEVLAQRNSTPKIEFVYHELGRSVDKGVEWIAKEHEGKLYLFTCNSDKSPCRATAKGLNGWKAAKVINENRTITLTESSMTEDWTPFGVHLYELTRD